MRTREMGRTGAGVSVVGQGTWNMERDDRREAIRALRRGLDLGMNHIDTAELYGSGEVERLVSEAIRGRRREVYLASKVLPQNASFEGTLRACERSLERLATDYLDLYLLHWPGGHPVEATLEAFARLRQDGKIRAYGVSNFDAGDLEQAVATEHGKEIACNQVLYHLEERAIEHDVLPAAERLGVSVVGYSPFGSGRFPSPRSRGGRVLAEIGAARGASPRQIALAFLIEQGGVFVIPKASRVEHVEANAAAGDLELTREERERIDRAFPRGRRRGLPVL